MRMLFISLFLLIGVLGYSQTITLHNNVEQSMNQQYYVAGASVFSSGVTGTFKNKWNLTTQVIDSQFYLVSYSAYPFFGSVSFSDSKFFKSLSGYFSYDVILNEWTLSPSMTITCPLTTTYSFGDTSGMYWNLGIDLKYSFPSN